MRLLTQKPDFTTMRKDLGKALSEASQFVVVNEWLADLEKNINPEDLNLIKLVDTADEATKVIEDFYGKYLLQPNF